MESVLSKSDYLRYLKCPQEFWLARNTPELFAAEPTLEYEHLRAQGYIVQRLVRGMSRFKDNADAEFETEFSTNDLYARCDIIIRDRNERTIDIYEVKSSGSVKPEHIDDVAFQKHVAELTGEVVGKCFVVTTNCDYTRRGEVDPDECFIIHDVTAEIALKNAEIVQKILEAYNYLNAEPVPRLADHCSDKHRCLFIQHHFPDIPEYSVFDVSRLHKNKLRDLLEQNIVDVLHIPPDFKLSEKQRRHVDCARTGEPVIDHDKISKILGELRFPLHFLDYETFSYAVPQFNGTRPFQQMAFQYSLYTIQEPCGEPVNNRFLSDGSGDPCLELAEHLSQAMAGKIGSVVVWNAQFERKCNEEIAAMHPEFAAFFADVNENLFDLMEIFSKDHYIHPGFKGRHSLKKVLPVVEPSLGYDFMTIADGMTASIRWFHAASKRYDADVCSQIFEDLNKYCNLDTYGMVAIYNALQEQCASALTPVQPV